MAIPRGNPYQERGLIATGFASEVNMSQYARENDYQDKEQEST